jgi:hypothetical protein
VGRGLAKILRCCFPVKVEEYSNGRARWARRGGSVVAGPRNGPSIWSQHPKAEGRRASSLGPVWVGTLSDLLSGASWTALGLATLIALSRGGINSSGLLGQALYVVALAGMLGGIVGLYARQASGYGLFGKANSLSAFCGTVVLFTGVLRANNHTLWTSIGLFGVAKGRRETGGAVALRNHRQAGSLGRRCYMLRAARWSF